MKPITLLVSMCFLSGILFSQTPVQDIQYWASSQYRKITSTDVEYFINQTNTSNEIIYGDYAYFDTDPTWMTDVTCLDSNRFVVVYIEEGDDQRGFAVVGIISGMNITFGTRYLFNFEETIHPRISTLDSNRFVISYADQVDLSYNTSANAIIGEVTGNSISFGNEFVYLDNMFWCFFHHYTVEALNPNLFVVSFVSYHMPGYGTSIIGRVQNDSISFSQAYPFVHITPVGNDPIGRTTMTCIDTNKFILTFSGCDTAFYAASRFGTVLGDSVDFGPECKFQTGTAERLVTITLDNNHIITAYVDAMNEDKGTLVKGTINGDSISFSEEYLFYPDWTTWLSATALDENTFIVACWDWVDNIHHGTACVGEVVEDTIFFGPFNSYSPDYCFSPAAGRVDDERFVMVYAGVGLDYLGSAVIGKINNDNEPIITTIDSTTTCPGINLSSINIQNMDDISSFSLSLSYDTNYLEFVGLQHIHQLLQNDTIIVTDNAGQINLYWESSEGISIINDTLCDLEFFASAFDSLTTLNLLWNSGSYYLDTAGYYTSSEFQNGKVVVNQAPEQPQMPLGPQFIDLNSIDTSEYRTHLAIGGDNYFWHLLPSEAGSISGYDTIGIVVWDNTFTGPVAYIFVHTINICGEAFSDSLVVDISPVELNQYNEYTEISIFPIPANDRVNIQSTIPIIGLFVTDFLGQTIFNSKLGSTSRIVLNTSSYKPGVYLLKISTEMGTVARRFVITR